MENTYTLQITKYPIFRMINSKKLLRILLMESY